MAVVRGKDFKLYRNTDDPYDNTPTWAEITNCRDVTRNLEPTMADASIRASEFKLQVSTQKDMSIDFQMVYDGGVDALAFENAFFSDGYIEMLDLDGAIGKAGSRGLRFMAQVSKFTVNEAMADVGLIDVSLVPAYYPTNLPRRVEVVTPGTVTDVT